MASQVVPKPENYNSKITNDIQTILSKIKDSSPSSKILMGTATGWITGLFVARVGKLVALSIGGGIILLQVAQENGLVKVNFAEVGKNTPKKVCNGLEEGALKRWRKKVVALVNYDSVLTSGFFGGFLIGLSTE